MQMNAILWPCLVLVLTTTILISFPNICSASIAHVVAAVAVAKDIITVVKEATSAVSDAWSVANNISTGSNNNNLPLILTRFKEVSNEISLTEDQHADPVNNFINLQLLAKRNDISNTINGIATRFKELKEYVIHQDNLESSTLLTFAEWTVSPNGFSVHHLMDRLHLTMFGADDEPNKLGSNIFETLVLSYGKEERCLNQQSPQQFIYSLYTDIALTELKAYTMMEFSYMILRAYGKGNFTQEAALKRNNYEKRTEKTVRLLHDVMQKADRIIWRCDPEKHVEGNTYEEVIRLLQGYIENEVDMSSNRDCMQSCAAYGRTKNEGCYMDQFCARQERCSGQIHDCYYAGYMKACPSPIESLRRYEYIDFNGNAAGTIENCARGESEVQSWMRYVFWECSYCFCLCDDQDSIKTERYFNLRDTLSNINDNKVVTGLRFTKTNRIFHLQIQEGQLLPGGVINASTLTWKPVEDYTLYERGVNNNQDYFTLTYDARSIDLDKIQSNDNTLVVTGVRFRIVRGHLNLQARFTKFNFQSGQLINPIENSFWKFHDVTEYKRTKIELKDLDVPVHSIAKSIPISNHNEYLQFSPSSLKTDVAQTTLPFIDIQDVVSMPAVPLSGVGLYYKRRERFGGFIAPQLITYDFVPHIHTERKT